MSKVAIIFPGQGAKSCMASDLFNEDKKATNILNSAQAMDF